MCRLDIRWHPLPVGDRFGSVRVIELVDAGERRHCENPGSLDKNHSKE
jgi:hypothetical protein